MAIKKLPLDLQSKFHASTQIRSFKTAVEELVYNALDANSSSIAVRVDIKENYIQVVDNGHGVAKDDFKIIGERYTTSKYDKSNASESVQMYGRYGQSLANLIEISQSVKITSKYLNNTETWIKHFCNGKENACSIVTERPSVGTTVEIKGFLYNLTIQKKAVKALQELQNIKTFLEQIALMHCNTSISLRDNSLNEVVVQIPKNRDIVKTFASVLNICIKNLQEFQVEKNEYRVTGFMQINIEEAKGYQWIYVNGRFIDNSNLHRIINEKLTKDAHIQRNIKIKSYNNEDEKPITKNKLPDYFIFIKCPKDDYDVISNYKHSIIEFKTVVHINKLLDKLVKFYMGDITLVEMAATNKEPINALDNNNLVEVTATNEEPINTLENTKAHEKDTRNKIKKIMQKILGSQRKKMDGSNLNNGVKGKIMKRKIKKERYPLTKGKLKFKDAKDQKKICETNDLRTLTNKHYINNEAVTPCFLSRSKPTANKNIVNSIYQQKYCQNDKRPNGTKNIPNKLNNHINNESGERFLEPTRKPLTKKKNANVNHLPKQINEAHLHPTNMIPGKVYNRRDTVLSKFEKETDEVQIRCNRLAKRVNNLLKVKKRRRCKIFSLETVHYSNKIKNNKSISVRKKNNEIIIHEYVPLAQRNMATKNENTIFKDIKRSKDLLRPITNIMNHENVEANLNRANIVQPQTKYFPFAETHSDIPGPTYESHGYLKDTQIQRPQCDILEKITKNQFICKTSRDNLASPITDNKVIKKQKVIKEMIHNKKITNLGLGAEERTTTASYSIHFTKTDSQICQAHKSAVNASHVTTVNNNDKFSIGSTFTIPHVNTTGSTSFKKLLSQTCTIGTSNFHAANSIRTPNVHLYSEKSPNILNTQKDTAATDERFDHNVVFISNSQLVNTGTLIIETIEPIRMCEAVIGTCDDTQNHEEIIENTFMFHSTNDVIGGNTEIQTGEMSESERELRRNITVNDDNAIDECLNIISNNNITRELYDVSYEPNNFNLKNRRRYIPKGMSPILQLCSTKNVNNYEFNADYFETTVYNNFARNVQIHSEIFEPKIQNLKETATRDIQRVDFKLHKDNACLTFNAESLQNAKVLGQVDRKFIATILNGNSNDAHSCLVLFDQHAVHERIRLEQNISDYISQDQWKSISVDGFSLKLSRDEILFLHNYRDKFERLGLQWSIASNNQVLVNAIPEAILGKHPRQVDVVLKAVHSLISEEISIIKEQSGCVSLYPKSMMDLVFSEACRYAIMFGTALPVRECSTLIEALSHCRTPFICAHGRPALAVLVDVTQESRPYTVNFTKMKQFQKIKNR
ncbi:uncharacterized protein LOC133516268 [Cydia pomonella]|uniref:uncharacterized protein LOC133516268 n=1 Tax=Cydia pomonella TaxID=82600 RepID=UPI002ADD7462|nr:uncharacterized protein LOC133516268 [Cydia pomonella]